MMPKPNQNRSNNNPNSNAYQGFSSENVLHETKPNFWLYSDNFILKIIVLFILVFMFSPIMTFVYVIHSQLVSNFHIAIDNVMFYTEIIIMLLILIVLIKLILDILDWNSTKYIFTDARVIIERGFIHKEKIIMSYSKIQDIEIRQSLIERIISVGDIILYGANEYSETILYDIPSPKKVEEIIINNVNAHINLTPNPNYYQANNNPYPNQQAYSQNGYNQTAQDNMQYSQQNNVNYYETDEEVIIPDRPTEERQYDNTKKISKGKPNKEEVFRKHDEMFKRHKK